MKSIDVVTGKISWIQQKTMLNHPDKPKLLRNGEASDDDPVEVKTYELAFNEGNNDQTQHILSMALQLTLVNGNAREVVRSQQYKVMNFIVSMNKITYVEQATIPDHPDKAKLLRNSETSDDDPVEVKTYEYAFNEGNSDETQHILSFAVQLNVINAEGLEAVRSQQVKVVNFKTYLDDLTYIEQITMPDWAGKPRLVKAGDLNAAKADPVQVKTYEYAFNVGTSDQTQHILSFAMQLSVINGDELEATRSEQVKVVNFKTYLDDLTYIEQITMPDWAGKPRLVKAGDLNAAKADPVQVKTYEYAFNVGTSDQTQHILSFAMQLSVINGDELEATRSEQVKVVNFKTYLDKLTYIQQITMPEWQWKARLVKAGDLNADKVDPVEVKTYELAFNEGNSDETQHILSFAMQLSVINGD
ncbi:MAG: hypothetical protein AABX33_01345, partial [Nanoarchaeota archaeon]